jgi:hypothetical protein
MNICLYIFIHKICYFLVMTCNISVMFMNISLCRPITKTCTSDVLCSRPMPHLLCSF